VVLRDALGRIVFAARAQETRNGIDVSGLPRGAYALTIAGRTLRLVVE
jgi:hypothetical protein